MISLEKKRPKATLDILRRHNANINGLLEKRIEFGERKNEQLLFFVERLRSTRKEYENVRRTLM